MTYLVIAGLVLYFLYFFLELDQPPLPKSSTPSKFKDVNDYFEYLDRSSMPTEIPDTLDLNMLKVYKQDYLKSTEWNTRRKQVLKRDSYSCKQCGITGVPMEVHHITYKRLTCENLKDLVTLCRDCHQHIHNRYGYDYNTNYPLRR